MSYPAEKLKYTVVFGLILVLFPQLATAADRYSGYFQEMGSTREQAYEAAVISVTREALANLIRDENWNYDINECLENWIQSELAPDYKYLVSNQIFDVDEKIRGQWALEGSMRIEIGFLQRWVRSQLTDGGCGPEIQQRRTVYIEPAKDELMENSAMLEAARNHVQQLLSRNGYKFVDGDRRQYAEFRLILESAEMSARGPVKTLNVSGLYIDNRIDGQPYLAINASVDERLRTTPIALDNALYERQAQSVLAQIREWEAAHIVDEYDVEIVFLSQKSERGEAELVLDEIINRFELPAEFGERADALQVSELDRDRIEISIYIPAKYGITLSRSRMRELRNVAQEILNYDVAASEFSDNATRLTILDTSAVEEAWEQQIWAHLDTGKLVLPENQSALSVVRERLARNPNDTKALNFLDEVISRLVQRAVYKMGQGALNSANSDLTLAETIGSNRPSQPWLSARRELDAAIERERTRIQIQISEQNQKPPATVVANDPPIILFPEIESWSARAISVQATGGIIGITAGVNGIKRIEVGGRSVNFDQASVEHAGKLKVPGAKTQEFFLSAEITAGQRELLVTVIDGKDNRAEKLLVANGNEFVVAEGNSVAAKVDGQILKEGESALQGNYHALIIANQDYQRVNDLMTPIHDAEALRTLLVDSYNFSREHIYTLINGTRSDIELAIDKLQDNVGPNDSLLIYFAGHGFQDKGHAGTGYWIPVDGKNPDEIGHRTSWISNTFVADYVEKVKARHVLLISDSCYAGTFAQRGDMADYFLATPEFIKTKAGQNSRRAITSGDVEPVLDGGADGHSIFAYHLLTVLRDNPGRYLTAEQLFKSVFQPVTQKAPQTPQYFVMSDNDNGGDFVFIRNEI